MYFTIRSRTDGQDPRRKADGMLMPPSLSRGIFTIRSRTDGQDLPIDGGLPLVVTGALVGAIGISGGTSAQDGEAAAACVAALTR